MNVDILLYNINSLLFCIYKRNNKKVEVVFQCYLLTVYYLYVAAQHTSTQTSPRCMSFVMFLQCFFVLLQMMQAQ